MVSKVSVEAHRADSCSSQVIPNPQHFVLPCRRGHIGENYHSHDNRSFSHRTPPSFLSNYLGVRVLSRMLRVGKLLLISELTPRYPKEASAMPMPFYMWVVLVGVAVLGLSMAARPHLKAHESYKLPPDIFK